MIRNGRVQGAANGAPSYPSTLSATARTEPLWCPDAKCLHLTDLPGKLCPMHDDDQENGGAA